MLNQTQNIKNFLNQCCYTEFERNEVADMLIDSLEWEINFFHNWNIVSPRPANWKEQAAQFAEMIKFIEQNKAKVKAIGKKMHPKPAGAPESQQKGLAQHAGQHRKFGDDPMRGDCVVYP